MLFRLSVLGPSTQVWWLNHGKLLGATSYLPVIQLVYPSNSARVERVVRRSRIYITWPARPGEMITVNLLNTEIYHDESLCSGRFLCYDF